MSMKRINLFVLVLASLLGSVFPSRAALPPDFPTCTVTTHDEASVGSGCIFLEVTDPGTNIGYYVMVLKNDGTPVWYQQVPDHIYDFKMLPNGFLHYAEFFHTHSWTGGGDVTHQVLDANSNPRATIQMGNGYLADGHDFHLLPNGNVLLLGYYRSQMDLSKIVSGAYPNALVAGAILQELDAARNVVFQWRSWDHYTFGNYYGPVLGMMPNVRNPMVDSFHVNTVIQDTDGNLLVSNYMMDVQKINRQTGEVMWRLGGLGNQFRFANVVSNVALTHFSCHTLSRLANSNLLLYCNADQQATRTSKVYQYQLDEVSKIATLVWSYAPPTNIYAWHYGSAQRLPNGNTFIGWGSGNIMPGVGGITNTQVPACTEVAPDGRVVFEMLFDNPRVASYRAYRFDWPPTNRLESVELELADGNTYVLGETGVTLDVITGGGGYNALMVTREPYAPVDPVFLSVPPRVLPWRVKCSESGIPSMEMLVSFDAISFGFSQPDTLEVYYRSQAGQGIFAKAPLQSYNPVAHQLQAQITLSSSAGDMGEFIFGQPDLAQVPYAPLLNEVESYRGVQPYGIIAPMLATSAVPCQVNQELPICVSWSPKGMAGSYELQISVDPDFATLEVAEPYLTTAFYVWSEAAPGTAYHYRVKTWNDGGESAWAVGSFQTVAPWVGVLVPNGGESWQRGLRYFIQWDDTLAEDVVIDLYKGGSFLKSIATNASTGAYKWLVGLDLAPGNDYSINVRSLTNGAMADLSDQAFNIADIVPVTIATDPAGLTVTVDGTNYTAPVLFNWLSGSSHSLDTASPQIAGDGSSPLGLHFLERWRRTIPHHHRPVLGYDPHRELLHAVPAGHHRHPIGRRHGHERSRSVPGMMPGQLVSADRQDQHRLPVPLLARGGQLPPATRPRSR